MRTALRRTLWVAACTSIAAYLAIEQQGLKDVEQEVVTELLAEQVLE